MATITLTNIQAYAQITTNIEDRLINPSISLSRTFDLDSVLTKALMTAVDTAIATPNSAPQLEAFYNEFIIPYWSLSAYHRFLATHGTNVTQFGVSVTRDPRGTFDQASEEQRAAILRQVHSDRKVFKQYMTDRLKEVNFTFDGVSFIESKTIDRQSGYITAIRKRPSRPNGGNYFNRFLD
jgi:hypothetical protein